jgi:hypothetical protein
MLARNLSSFKLNVVDTVLQEIKTWIVEFELLITRKESVNSFRSGHLFPSPYPNSKEIVESFKNSFNFKSVWNFNFKSKKHQHKKRNYYINTWYRIPKEITKESNLLSRWIKIIMRFHFIRWMIKFKKISI